MALESRCGFYSLERQQERQVSLQQSKPASARPSQVDKAESVGGLGTWRSPVPAFRVPA